MTNIINTHEILTLLPHRPPFLLIDRIIYFKKNESLQAIKNVSYNEPFLYNHFPNKPIFPGVLIIEAIAQATNILTIKSTENEIIKKPYYLASINSAHFKYPVYPGDQIFIEVQYIKKKKSIINFNGIAKINKTIVCKTSIICTNYIKEK